MALLMKMETKATLGNMLVSAFGQWYLHLPINIIRFAKTNSLVLAFK